MTKLWGLMAFLAIAACSGGVEEVPDNEDVSPAEVMQETTLADASPDVDAERGWSEEWLHGTWSFAGTCRTDHTVTFEPDGDLYASEVSGTYAIDGATVTETISEEHGMGDPDGPTVIDPPNVYSYEVRRIDDDHAEFTYEDDPEPLEMLRCS